MSINYDIYEEIKNVLEIVYWFDTKGLEEIIYQTNVNQYSYRQDKACKLVGYTMNRHGKEQLFKALEQLARVESGIQDLEPYQRDHVVHAVFTFILGVYLMKICPEIKIDPFEWKLAALFHDVAYPVQIAAKMIGEFSKTMDQMAGNTRKRSVKIDPSDYTELNGHLNGLTLIQNRINQWNIDIDAHGIYSKMIRSGKGCHGIYSSIILLAKMDDIYQDMNPLRKKEPFLEGGFDWDQRNFENEVVSACTAIFLHNLDLVELGKIIDYNQSPLAYLLKLCDILQDWERPSKEEPIGISAELYKIEKDAVEVIFYLPESRKGKIENELSCVQGLPIVIRCTPPDENAHPYP